MFRPKSTPRGRRGGIVVKVAICLPVLIGVVALSLDGGLLYDKRRHCQAASDAAGSPMNRTGPQS